MAFFKINTSATVKWTLFAYTLFIATIFILAYIGLIPTRLHAIPFYDSAGHFILYGCWGFCLGWTFSKTLIRISVFKIYIGIMIAMAIATIEEFLQQLSPLRTFSLLDLFWGILGIVVACIILNCNEKKLKI